MHHASRAALPREEVDSSYCRILSVIALQSTTAERYRFAEGPSSTALARRRFVCCSLDDWLREEEAAGGEELATGSSSSDASFGGDAGADGLSSPLSALSSGTLAGRVLNDCLRVGTGGSSQASSSSGATLAARATVLRDESGAGRPSLRAVLLSGWLVGRALDSRRRAGLGGEAGEDLGGGEEVDSER